MAGLSVGVVRDEVERADFTKGRMPLFIIEQGEVVLLEHGWNEELEGTQTRGTVDDDGRRNVPPAELLGEEEGSGFALVERTWKVPEGPFASLWFVDRLCGPVIADDEVDQKGRVRAVWHPAKHIDLGGCQQQKRFAGRHLWA